MQINTFFSFLFTFFDSFIMANLNPVFPREDSSRNMLAPSSATPQSVDRDILAPTSSQYIPRDRPAEPYYQTVTSSDLLAPSVLKKPNMPEIPESGINEYFHSKTVGSGQLSKGSGHSLRPGSGQKSSKNPLAPNKPTTSTMQRKKTRPNAFEKMPDKDKTDAYFRLQEENMQLKKDHFELERNLSLMKTSFSKLEKSVKQEREMAESYTGKDFKSTLIDSQLGLDTMKAENKMLMQENKILIKAALTGNLNKQLLSRIEGPALNKFNMKPKVLSGAIMFDIKQRSTTPPQHEGHPVHYQEERTDYYKIEYDRLYPEYLDLKNKYNIELEKNRELEERLKTPPTDNSREIYELREKCKMLERQLADSLQTPFLKEDSRYKTLQIELNSYKERGLKIDSSMVELAEKLRLMTIDRDRYRDEFLVLQARLGVKENYMKEFETQLRSIGGMDLNAFMKALGLMKLRGDEPAWSQLNFLEEGTAIPTDLQGLRREIERLKLEKGQLAAEVEKSQSLLVLRNEMEKEKTGMYETEIEQLKIQLRSAQQRTDELARLADYRATRVVQLERNQRLNTYDEENRIVGTKTQITVGELFNSAPEFQESGTEMATNENILDLFIGEAEFYQSALEGVLRKQVSITSSFLSFLTVDFYNMETQSTSLCESLRPKYNIHISFKVAVNDAFIKTLQTGYIYLEGHASKGDSHITFARASIPLKDLLTRTGAISELNTKTGVIEGMTVLVSNFDGKTSVGSHNYKIRMRHPLSEAMRWFREKEEIVELANPKQYALDTVYSYTGPSRTRELIFTIFKCMGLKGQVYPGNLRPFVFFQFYTEPEQYTSIAIGPDPVYDQTFKLNLMTTGDLKKYMDMDTLEILVFDDNAPIREGGQDVIGTAKVPLNALLMDTAIEGTYLLYNMRGQETGRITLRVAWKDSKVDELGYGTPLTEMWEREAYERIGKALSSRGLGLESGFKVFDQDQDGLISPQEFRNTILLTLRLPLSEQEIQLLINACNLTDGGITKTMFRQKLSNFLASDRTIPGEKSWEEGVLDLVRNRINEKKLNLNDAFAAFDENKDGFISAAEFIKAFRIMQLGLSENEIEAILRYFDVGKTGKIEYRIFCEKIQGQQGGSWEEKILTQVRNRIKEKNLSVRQAFSAFDENKDGIISKGEFIETFMVMQLGLSQPDIEKLFLYFDPNKTNRIDYNIFCDKLENIRSGLTVEEKILELVKRRINEKNLSVKQAFLAFDENKDGMISRNEFLKTFRIMDLGVQDNDIVKLFTYFDPNNTGCIDYRVFCSRLQESSNRSAGSDWEESILNRVRSRIQEKNLSIKQAFLAFDENKDGMISKAEFLKTFRIMDLGIPDSDIEKLFGRLDARSIGVIDYRVFCDRLQNPVVSTETQPANKFSQIIAMVKKRIQENNLSLKKAFEAFDENKDGNITRLEFLKAFKAMELGVSDSDVEQVFQSFDVNHTGTIDYREFIERIQGLERRPSIRGENMEERIMELVKKRIAEKNLSIRQAFLAFDDNKDGKISEPEFLKAFRIMDLGVHDNEARSLFKSIDKNNSGTIDYQEFCEQVQSTRVERSSTQSFQTVKSERPTDALLDQIRSRIREKNLSVREAFLAFDDNKDGKINESEFLKTMKIMELGVSDLEIRNLFRFFDKDRTGTIEYREFCDKVQVSAPRPSSVSSEDELINRIRIRINEKNLSIRQAFLAFDENKDGSISKPEFLKAFRIMDLGVTDSEVERLFSHLDSSRRGSIDYKIFCNTIQESSAPSRESDESWERNIIVQLRQRITDKKLSLRQAFSAFDENRDGKISKQEFSKSFQTMQLGLNEEEINRLFAVFDLRKLGVIDYNLFCDKIQETGSVKSSPSENWEEKVMEAVRNRIREKNLSIRQAFLAFDENKDGMISSKEFMKAFSIMDLGIPQADVNRLFDSFDPRRTGSIDYRVFCDRLQVRG